MSNNWEIAVKRIGSIMLEERAYKGLGVSGSEKYGAGGRTHRKLTFWFNARRRVDKFGVSTKLVAYNVHTEPLGFLFFTKKAWFL